jgi:hypothetical protein
MFARLIRKTKDDEETQTQIEYQLVDPSTTRDFGTECVWSQPSGPFQSGENRLDHCQRQMEG